MDVAVLVPVKSFGAAKARLAPLLDVAERARFARWCAARVLAAAGPLPTFVACDDQEVAAWAVDRGATVLWHPGEGLNPAVNHSIDELRIAGFDHAVIAHGDLPLVDRWSTLVERGVVTLVPDRRDDGTNVISLPTACGFEVSYGPSSFRRHLATARSSALAVTVRRDPLLAIDVDTPDDLCQPAVVEVLPPWLVERTSLVSLCPEAGR